MPGVTAKYDGLPVNLFNVGRVLIAPNDHAQHGCMRPISPDRFFRSIWEQQRRLTWTVSYRFPRLSERGTIACQCAAGWCCRAAPARRPPTIVFLDSNGSEIREGAWSETSGSRIS